MESESPLTDPNLDFAAELQLSRPAQFTKGLHWRDINRHPAFCWVCTNFDPAVAEFFVAQYDRVWYQEASGACMVDTALRDVLDAATEGCSSCLLLKACLVAFEGEAILERAGSLAISVTYCVDSTMVVHWSDDDSGEEGEAIQMFVEPGERCPWTTIASNIRTYDVRMARWPWVGGLSQVVPTDATSNTCFQGIASWIESCLSQHPWCNPQHNFNGRKIKRNAYTPTRLLYVGSHEKDLRLVCTESTGIVRPTYVTLSYCWGKTRKLTTTRRNLQQLQASLPFAELVRTCQDAVLVARRLGFEYLWVDSLCIVQDDKEDWEREAANMAAIYGGAFLCIAASAGTDGDSGLFVPRKPTKAFSIRDVEGGQSRILARHTSSHAAFDWNNPSALNSTTSRGPLSPGEALHLPLFGRGWAYQERLLSPRILHFTADELIWECLGHTNCQCGTLDRHVASAALRDRRFVAGVPQDVEISFNSLDRARSLARRLGHLPAEPGSHDQENFRRSINPVAQYDYALYLVLGVSRQDLELYDSDTMGSYRWHTLCRAYSQRTLTFSTDTLPALAGLAAAWADIYQEKTVYLAGIWQHELLRDLLWKYVDTPHVERQPKDEYLAPSWSWANMRRAVEFLQTNHEPRYHVSILEAQCHSSNVSPFGEVSSGSIKLRGLCSVGVVLVTPRGSGNFYLRSHKDVSSGSRSRNGNFQADCVPECIGFAGREVTVLRYSIDVNDERTGFGWERALVLHLVKEQEQVYRRIGIVEHLDREDEGSSWGLPGIVWEETTLQII